MRIVTMGKIASDIINKKPEISVIGETSRGIFLRASLEWILFLSLETYRGPLTLNLSGDLGKLDGLESRDPVHIESGSLYFPSIDLRLPVGGAEVWQPSRPILALINTAAVLPRLESVSAQMPSLEGEFSSEGLEGLRASLRAGDASGIVSAVERLLGQGPGLTPSGDDLAIGLLLAMNRWRALFAPGLPVEGINRGICEAARSKTTLLSANLIACAAQGFADERLIQALDGLVTGTPDAATCASLLRGWGHHSGCASFTGMATALQWCCQDPHS